MGDDKGNGVGAGSMDLGTEGSMDGNGISWAALTDRGDDPWAWAAGRLDTGFRHDVWTPFGVGSPY